MTGAPTPLSDFQRTVLQAGGGQFDGYTKHNQVEEVMNLVSRGYLTAQERGSDEAQYTYVNVEITDAGCAALDKPET